MVDGSLVEQTAFLECVLIKLKAQASVVGLGVALVVILGVYSMMGTYFDMSEVERSVKLPSVGRPVLDREILAPFLDKWSGADELRDEKAFGVIAAALKKQERSELLKRLALEVELQHLVAAPRRYVGQLIALRFDGRGEVMVRDDLLGYSQWRRISDGDLSFEIGLLESYEGGDGQSCGEFVFLGEKRGESSVYLLVAKSLYEVAVDGRYPVLQSDEVALSMLVDEMDNPALHAMARGVPSAVLSHYFAKTDGQRRTGVVEKGDYNDLMDAPERFRGQEFRFTGTLIFKRLRHMSSLELPAGMEITAEGYLLDSNRALFLFRAPTIPHEIEIDDLVTVEGYFLQRTNFLNRMGRATWAPLLVATSIKKEAPLVYGLSSKRQRGVGLGLVVLGVIGFWWLIRKKEHRRYRRKRVVGSTKEDSDFRT